MKFSHIILSISAILLAACSQTQQKAAILDPATVQAYQAQVSRAPDSARQPIKTAPSTVKAVELPLNASDKQGKFNENKINSIPVMIVPSIGYHYHRRYHW